MSDAVRKPPGSPKRTGNTAPLRIEDFSSPTEMQSKQERREAFSERPWVSYGLLALNVTLFLAMLGVSRQHIGAWGVGGGAFSTTESLFGAMDSALIRQGQWQRLVTPIFLHGGLLHLVVNSLSLLWLGAQIETIYGGRRYFLIYLLAGVAGNLASFSHGTPISLGASGALFGLIGAGMVFPIRWRHLLQERERNSILKQMLMVAVVNLGIGFTVPHIDNFAHMGGLIGGAFAALFFLPDILDDRPAHRPRELLLSLLVLGAAGFLVFCGVRQWNLAKQTPIPQVFTLTTYRPSPASDWEIGIPEGWTRDRDFWKNGQGATFDFADSANPKEAARAKEAVQFVQASRPARFKMNGVTMLRGAAAGPKVTLDISLFVLSRQRVVAVIFACPNEKHSRILRDILLVTGSFLTKGGITAPVVRTPSNAVSAPAPSGKDPQ